MILAWQGWWQRGGEAGMMLFRHNVGQAGKALFIFQMCGYESKDNLFANELCSKSLSVISNSGHILQQIWC